MPVECCQSRDTDMTTTTPTRTSEGESPALSIDRKALASIVKQGDLSLLSEAERIELIARVCQQLGLDPLLSPFIISRIGNRTVLYARRSATDQLSARHGLTREITDGPRMIELGAQHLSYAVCRVSLADRFETGTGSVLVTRANVGDALMLAETKAKRRTTLAFLGLGMLDETEVPESSGQLPESVALLLARVPREVTDAATAAAFWASTRSDRRDMPKAHVGALWRAALKAGRCPEGELRALVTAGSVGNK